MAMEGGEPYDLVIRGGTVFDGAGVPGVRADVGVRGDRIVAVGEVAGRGAREIDAAGLAVSPGFIDVHSDGDLAVLMERCQFPDGIRAIFVNGVQVADAGVHTGARPGRALRRGM